MGTRALINVRAAEKSSTIFTTIYHHMDGYPDYLGEKIKEVLGDRQLVNGVSDPEHQVNGMGCAAAMLVGALKNGECGGVYIYSAGTNDVWEDYVYDLYAGDKRVRMSVKSRDEELFDGDLSDFSAEKCTDDEDDEVSPSTPTS